MIVIDQNSCVGCGACIDSCPGNILELNSDACAQIVPGQESNCIGCQICVDTCPVCAVSDDSVDADNCLPKGELPSEKQMRNLIQMHRSTRTRSDRPIEPEMRESEMIERPKSVLNGLATDSNHHGNTSPFDKHRLINNVNAKIAIDQKSCVRCGACVRECPGIILEQNADGIAQVISSRESCCIGCQHCVAICPAGAVSVDGVGADDCLPKGELPSEEQMLNLIRMRRSTRSWSDRPIEPETIESLKNALNWTATGCNHHSLRFTFVTSPAVFDELRTKIYGFVNRPIINRILRWKFKKFNHYFDAIKNRTDVIFRNAPGMVIASVPKSAPCAAFDPVIALSNFDLYAQTLGLGTCWCGFAEGIFKHCPKLVRGLDLPKGYHVGAVMLFGYPSAPYLRSTAQKPFETQLIE